MAMHPETWNCMGVQLKRQVYIMGCVAFGVAPACNGVPQIIQQATEAPGAVAAGPKGRVKHRGGPA